eukprot:2007122-Pleurochrysis_carterae.AAC.2
MCVCVRVRVRTLRSARTASTARLMPRRRSIGFMPAATDLQLYAGEAEAGARWALAQLWAGRDARQGWVGASV